MMAGQQEAPLVGRRRVTQPQGFRPLSIIRHLCPTRGTNLLQAHLQPPPSFRGHNDVNCASFWTAIPLYFIWILNRLLLLKHITENTPSIWTLWNSTSVTFAIMIYTIEKVVSWWSFIRFPWIPSWFSFFFLNCSLIRLFFAIWSWHRFSISWF